MSQAEIKWLAGTNRTAIKCNKILVFAILTKMGRSLLHALWLWQLPRLVEGKGISHTVKARKQTSKLAFSVYGLSTENFCFNLKHVCIYA